METKCSIKLINYDRARIWHQQTAGSVGITVSSLPYLWFILRRFQYLRLYSIVVGLCCQFPGGSEESHGNLSQYNWSGRDSNRDNPKYKPGALSRRQAAMELWTLAKNEGYLYTCFCCSCCC
jgi:hypothetical protein